MHIHMHTHTPAHTHARTHTHAHTHMHTHTCTHTHAHTHMHTHTHAHTHFRASPHHASVTFLWFFSVPWLTNVVPSPHRNTGTTTHTINLGSYNYLGFGECHGRCAETSVKATYEYGVGCCSSRRDLGEIFCVSVCWGKEDWAGICGRGQGESLFRREPWGIFVEG